MTQRYGQLANFTLKVTDLLLMMAALGLGIVLNYAPVTPLAISDYAVDFLQTRVKVGNVLLVAVLLSTWYVAFFLQGVYRSHRLSALREELAEVGRAIFFSSAALMIIAQLGKWPTITVWTAVSVGLIALLLIGGTRALLRLNLRRLRYRGHNLKKLIIVGTGSRAEWFAKQVLNRADYGYRLVGYVDSKTRFNNNGLSAVPWLGDVPDLARIISSEIIDEVFIALPIKSQYSQIESAINLLEEQGIMVHLASDNFPHRLARSRPWEFEGTPLLSLHSAPPVSWRTEIKRLMDVLGAAILLVLLMPLLVVVAIAIKVTSEGPILFVQERVGLNKRRFRMLKFRTMNRNAESQMKEIEHLNEKSGAIFKIKNDPRITTVGRWLRKTSIDELPQLINVLLGDMSIVGPRPLTVRDANLIEEAWQKRRFSVKPGLTCLWQVSGRSNLSFEQWMKLDLEYIDSWSLVLDWSILLRTIPAILTARGAT
ncbi:MAG TPA: sugar transferase [Pyrinomonadaceae bacterium]|nr:sugar transferase [Pyrinomonadaceae bacterium]